MPLIRSTSSIISIISLYYEAKLNFFAESKTSLKILHFRTTSASTICLFFPSNFEPMLWSIRNKTFYVLGENSKLSQENQSCFVLHDWSIKCREIFQVLLTRSETQDCFSKFSWFLATFFIQIEAIM